MVDETRYRPLLDRAQGAGESIKTFLAAVIEAPAGDVPEIRELATRTQQQLEQVQSGIDQLWDLFKRQP